jgi:hypothetical protein
MSPPTPTETVRAQLAGFLALPVVQQPERPWHPEQATAEVLALAERKASPRRFTSQPITGFGEPSQSLRAPHRQRCRQR